MQNKTVRVIVSVVISLVLWLYVVSVVSPEAEETFYDIPVSYQNDVLEERGLMIVSDTPTVTIKAKGNRSDLNELNANNITVLADLASIQAPGTHMLTPRVIYPGNMAVETLSRNPSVLQLKVENKVKKQVPILLDYVGAVPEGFLADKENPLMDTTAVEVVGPESSVEKIDHALIQVDLTDKTESVIGAFTYDLCDQEGNPVDADMVTTNVEEVNLSIKVQRIKEIALTLNVVDGGGATADSAKIEQSNMSLWVSGSENILKDLTSVELGTVNLAELKKDNNTLTFAVVLPDGITNESGVTEVTVDISFPNLARKKFTIPKERFTTIGIPTGGTANWITEMVEVELRGPKKAIESITESDISVIVDFTDEALGSVSKVPRIVLSNAYSTVGPISVSQVTAMLQVGESDAAIG